MRGNERVVIDGQRHEIPRAWITGMVVILQRDGHDPLEARVMAVLRWHEQVQTQQAKTADPTEEQRRRAEALALQASPAH